MTDSARADETGFPLTSWWLLGLLLLLVALVVRAPASLLQKAVPRQAGIQVSAWGGTVWSGQAAWEQAGARGMVRWTLAPSRLLLGRIEADIRSDGGVPLRGTVVAGPGRFEVRHLQGAIPAALFQSLLPPGWRVPGVVRAEQLGVARAGLRQGAWTAAAGEMTWEGGALELVLSGQAQQMALPPVRLVPGVEQGALVLVLAEAASGLGLARLRVAPDGGVQTEVRERLLRYNPSYRSSGADPDSVVVTTREAG